MQLGDRSEGAAPQGEFALLRVMGEPGSDVFQARSTDGRDVVLRFSRALNEVDARNAIETANRARGVRHPMIATVWAVREHVDGTLCLVSEYVAGRTLDAWTADLGLPPLRMAVDFVRRLALGLEAAVQRGLTHHAVYPGNIYVAEPDTKPQGRIVAKLADLGVARPQQTLRFEVAHFLAPEELSARLERGGRTVPVTASMNVYSCGCLLHYLCTGQPPFQSDTLGGLTALHTAGAIAVPSQVNRDIPPHLERVIAHALERDPKKRIANPGALAASLSHVETVWRSSGVRRRSTTVPPPPPPAARTERVSQIPAFDLVLRPSAPTNPRTGVVAKAVEPTTTTPTTTATTMRGVPQLFQRPAKRDEALQPGRTTLVGGFSGRAVDRPSVPPERVDPAIEKSAEASGRHLDLALDRAAEASELLVPAIEPESVVLEEDVLEADALETEETKPVSERALYASVPSASAAEQVVSANERTTNVAQRAVPALDRAAETAERVESASGFSVSERAAAVRQRIATAREFSAIRAELAESSSKDRVAVVPERVADSRESAAASPGQAISLSETSELELAANVSRELAAKESRELAAKELAAKESRERAVMASRERAALLMGRSTVAREQGAASAKPLPPRGLGWPFAVPAPAGVAATVPVLAPKEAPSLNSGFSAKQDAEPKLDPSARAEQGEKLSNPPSRSFGRVPSMFGRPMASAVQQAKADESATTQQPKSPSSAASEPVSTLRPKFPSLRELFANRAAKRDVDSTSEAVTPSAVEAVTTNAAEAVFALDSADTAALADAPDLSASVATSEVSATDDLLSTSESASADEAVSTVEPVSTDQLVSVDELVSADEFVSADEAVSPDQIVLADAAAPADEPELTNDDSVEVVESIAVAPVEVASADVDGGDAVESVDASPVAVSGDEAIGVVDVGSVDAGSGVAVSFIDVSPVVAVNASVVASEIGAATDVVDTSSVSVDGESATESIQASSVVVESETADDADDNAYETLRVDSSTEATSSTEVETSTVAAFVAVEAVSDSAVAPAPAGAPATRRRFASTVRYGSELVVPLVDTAAESSTPDPDGLFFNPHETTTAVGEAFFIPPRSAAAVPPPLPLWNAPDSSASIIVTPPPLTRQRRTELTPVPRDSLSAYELPTREARVSPREDFIFDALQPRPRTSRRWPWIAAASVGLGAYVSLFALHDNRSEPHATSRPNAEHAVEIVRAEGQAFPITADWQPALEPTNLAPAPVAVTEPSEASPEAPRAVSDSSESTRPSRSVRKADQLLDSMQVSRAKAGVQLRPETREPVVVYVPSSPSMPTAPAVPQGRVPVSPRPIVYSEVWATPSVVQAAELRPATARNLKVAQPSSEPSAVGRQPSAAARTENLEVRGSLSDHTVRRAIERIRPQLNECFTQHGSSSLIASTVRVELTIDETGRTRDARVQGATGALDECLVQASRKLVAGAPDTGTVKVAWNVRGR